MTEPVRDHSEVLNRFRTAVAIIQNDPYVTAAIRYIQSCFDPATPTYELSSHRVEEAVTRIRDRLPSVLPIEAGTNVFSAQTYLQKRFAEMGFLPERLIRTIQEHKLIGSSFDRHPEVYEKPHRPNGLHTNELNLEEVKRARELQGRAFAFATYFEDPPESVFVEDARNYVWVTLEPLDENGNTVRDPQLVAVVEKKLVAVETKYKPNFPFRRE